MQAFSCPLCHNVFHVQDADVGHDVICPHCKAKAHIPQFHATVVPIRALKSTQHGSRGSGVAIRSVLGRRPDHGAMERRGGVENRNQRTSGREAIFGSPETAGSGANAAAACSVHGNAPPARLKGSRPRLDWACRANDANAFPRRRVRYNLPICWPLLKGGERDWKPESQRLIP